MIVDCFHREIPSADGLIEVVRAEGGPHVSVYSGPFCWQIDLHDLSSTQQLLGRVLSGTRDDWPALPLTTGDTLHIGIGAEKTHLWISSSAAHLRIPLATAHALLGAISEAKAHVTKASEAARDARAERRAQA